MLSAEVERKAEKVMAEPEHLNNRDSNFEAPGLSLFECCSCHSSMHDPVLLNCLHYYCRPCCYSSDRKTQVLTVTSRPLVSPLLLSLSPLSLALQSLRPLSLCSLLSVYSRGLHSHSVSSLPELALARTQMISTAICPACFELTESSTLLIDSVLNTYKHASSLRAEIVRCNTCPKNAKEKAAEFWCVDCTEALCAACYVRHNKFSNGHRIFDLEHAQNLPLSQLIQTAHCTLHEQSMKAHCFTCCLLKCPECLDSCTAGRHDILLLSDEKYQVQISSVKNKMKDAADRLNGLLPNLSQKCRAITRHLHALRTAGQRMLVKHRRRLHDSTLSTFDVSEGEICYNLQSTRNMSPDALARVVPLNCSANIKGLALSGVHGMQLLGARKLLKTVASYCYTSCRASILRLLNKCKRGKVSMSISGAVPLTSDIVLSACLGVTDRKLDTHHQTITTPPNAQFCQNCEECWIKKYETFIGDRP